MIRILMGSSLQKFGYVKIRVVTRNEPKYVPGLLFNGRQGRQVLAYYLLGRGFFPIFN